MLQSCLHLAFVTPCEFGGKLYSSLHHAPLLVFHITPGGGGDAVGATVTGEMVGACVGTGDGADVGVDVGGEVRASVGARVGAVVSTVVDLQIYCHRARSWLKVSSQYQSRKYSIRVGCLSVSACGFVLPGDSTVSLHR